MTIRLRAGERVFLPGYIDWMPVEPDDAVLAFFLDYDDEQNPINLVLHADSPEWDRLLPEMGDLAYQPDEARDGHCIHCASDCEGAQLVALGDYEGVTHHHAADYAFEWPDDYGCPVCAYTLRIKQALAHLHVAYGPAADGSRVPVA